MQAFYQSHFLQSLGFAIANSLWQVALLLLIAIFYSGLNTSSNSKYRIAFIMQLTGFCWFVFTLSKAYFSKDYPAESFSFHLTTSFRTVSGNNIFLQNIFPVVSSVYLLLLIFFIAKWCRSYNYTSFIKNNTIEKINAEWCTFTDKYVKQFSIRKKVKIHLSPLVKSPSTIGFFKPVILIPLAAINQLSTEQMEAVILHELAHIQRADYFFNLFQTVIETILFFNPFILLLGKLINTTREICCDEQVINHKYSRDTYTEALIKIAFLSKAQTFAMYAVGNSSLTLRIKKILYQPCKISFTPRQLFFTILTVAGFAVFTFFNEKENTIQKPSQQKILFFNKNIKPNSYKSPVYTSIAKKETKKKSIPNKEKSERIVVKNKLPKTDKAIEKQDNDFNLLSLAKVVEDSSVVNIIQKMAYEKIAPETNISDDENDISSLIHLASNNEIHNDNYYDTKVYTNGNTCIILHKPHSLIINTNTINEGAKPLNINITKIQKNNSKKELIFVEILATN